MESNPFKLAENKSGGHHNANHNSGNELDDLDSLIK